MLLVTNRCPVVHLPLAHERGVEPREVAVRRQWRLGGEHANTLISANNYASLLKKLGRFKEAKSLMRKSIPTARRVIGDNSRITLTMRRIYAVALYEDPGATLKDLREAVTTFEEIEPTARRVFGGSHPTTTAIEGNLLKARAALRARKVLQTSNELAAQLEI